jgi:hypothetical protein
MCCPTCAGVNEQQLFHGTSTAAATAIAQEGFDCRLCSAGAYGQGTYFSDRSDVAIRYSRAKESTNRGQGGSTEKSTLTLLVARVLLGRQCEGKRGL